MELVCTLYPGLGASCLKASLKELAITIGTFALFVGIFGLLEDWRSAIGFGALILIHEAGHMIAGALRRIAMTPPVFIPLMGAYVRWREEPASAADEAIVAAGGPAAGMLASFALWAAWAIYPEPVLRQLAFAGFALHLINLVPIFPLDGGRMVHGVSRWISWLTVPPAVFMAALSEADSMVFLMAFHGFGASQKAPGRYYHTTGRQKALMAAGYLGLAGLTYLGYWGMGGLPAGVLRFGRLPGSPPNLKWALIETGIALGIGLAIVAFRWWERRVQTESGQAEG